MEIQYLGHSCFQIMLNELKVIIDPHIKANPLAKAIDFDELTPDIILVTHGHEDHMSDAIELATKKEATVISNFEIATWFSNKGVKNTHPMNLGGSWDISNIKLTYVNAVHSSSLPDGSYGGSAGGFIIETEGKTIYHAGDTALSIDMKVLSEKFNINLAMLPIGDNLTMGMEDAVKASEFIGCNNILGMHFDTFEIIKINHNTVKQYFKNNNKNFTIPEVGEVISI